MARDASRIRLQLPLIDDVGDGCFAPLLSVGLSEVETQISRGINSAALSLSLVFLLR